LIRRNPDLVEELRARDAVPFVQDQVLYQRKLRAEPSPDGREYDRTPSANMAMPWQSDAPNGVVTLSAVLVVLAQVATNIS
jgi:hypothetical protein